jgi:hypothetical protein
MTVLFELLFAQPFSAVHPWDSSAFFFSEPYLNELFSVRQVLTLFGAQNDPNDQAAFLLVGIAIALYFLMNKSKKTWLESVVGIDYADQCLCDSENRLSCWFASLWIDSSFGCSPSGQGGEECYPLELCAIFPWFCCQV